MSYLILLASILLASGPSRGEIVKFGPCTIVFEPEPCNTTYLQFYLFARSGPKDGEIVTFLQDWDNITSSHFDSAKENKVIIHGYNADINLFALQDIKNEYLKQGDYNVWMLNWSPLVSGICYPAALHNVAHAGRCLATAVQRLRLATQNLELHVVGFSLGAHVPAAAALLLRPYVIPRITGLDPAMPGFLIVERRERLSSKSAYFVDVIHTNGLMQGLIEPLGHIDFYMNGGISQPGCFKDGILDWLNCDHVRAPEYFAESINTKTGFWGQKCHFIIAFCEKNGETAVLAGEHVNSSVRGTYAVVTNSASPYAKGKQNINSNVLSSKIYRINGNIDKKD